MLFFKFRGLSIAWGIVSSGSNILFVIGIRFGTPYFGSWRWASSLSRPLLASLALTWMLAIMLIAVGIMRVVVGIQHRGTSGWGWAVFGGAITVRLGLMILAWGPLGALWIIGLFLAIELIVNGWTEIFVALAARTAGRSRPASGQAAGAAGHSS